MFSAQRRAGLTTDPRASSLVRLGRKVVLNMRLGMHGTIPRDRDAMGAGRGYRSGRHANVPHVWPMEGADCVGSSEDRLKRCLCLQGGQGWRLIPEEDDGMTEDAPGMKADGQPQGRS
jgi:hypothetical protein